MKKGKTKVIAQSELTHTPNQRSWVGDYWPKFKYLTIHLKFILFLMALILVPFTITISTLEWLHYQSSYNILIKKLDKLSANHTLFLAKPVFYSHKEEIFLTVSALLSDPDIIAIEILNPEGQRLNIFGRKPLDNKLTRSSKITYVNNDQIQTVGYLNLSLTDTNIKDSIKKRVYERFIMVAVFVLVLISAYIALRYTVGSALKKILDAVDKNKQLGITVPIKWQGKDELGQVVKAFNNMQQQQADNALALQHTRDQLEHRVQLRTESLQQEISAREQIEQQLRLQEQELNEFLNGVPVMLWMVDPDNSMRFNDSWLEFTGNTLAQELAIEWNGNNIHPDFRSHCKHTYQAAIEQRQPYHLEYPCRRHDSEYRWLAETGRPRFSRQGEYLGYFGTCTDITNQKLTEQQLFDEKERAQVTLCSIGEGVITTDAKSCVTFMNPVAEHLIGWSLEQAQGNLLTNVFRIVHDKTRSPLPNPAQQCLQEKRILNLPASTLLLSHDNKEYVIQDSVAPIYDQKQQIIGTIIVFADVTKSHQLAEKLSYQASHDSLTNLVNRREMELRLQQTLEDSYANCSTHALLYLDLDQFKIINDTSGHVAGDELLKQLANILANQLRSSDTLARLGGDEFGILMKDCPLDKAKQMANDLCQIVENYRFIWNDKNYTIGVSIGLTPLNEKTISINQLLIDADTACYAAKDAGRHRVHVFKVDDSTLSTRYSEMEWVSKIDLALDQDMFLLYCQPISSLNNQLSRHYEVLIRLHQKNGSIISPGSFLPAAERYGLAYRIDQWVIVNTFNWIKRNAEILDQQHQFSINLSGHSLDDDTLLPFIISTLKKTEISALHICFEITETAAIANLTKAIDIISHLKTLGFQFALDDFGTGLSSFAYLKQLPVDYLKIDGFFVKGMHQDAIDLEMVRSIHGIGLVMGKQTIAEGVENEDTIPLLQEIGVDYVQGFAIGKPQPLATLLKP